MTDANRTEGMGPASAPPRRVSRGAALALVLLLGAALRVTFLLYPPTVMDSDNALYGVMARHIVEGERPIFTYGQHYMGALESYVAAAFFTLFGASTYTLKLSPLLFSLLFLAAVYLLGRELYGEGPALWALAFVSLGPPTLLVWSATPRGGYSETLFFGTAVLWLALRVLRKRDDGLWEWVAMGLAAGLGFWTHFLIAYYLLPVSLALLFGLGRRAFRRGPAAAAAAFLLGSLPFWIYNLPRGFVSLRMGAIGTGSPEQILGTFFTVQIFSLLHLKGKYFEAIPGAAGAWLVAGGALYLLLATVLLVGSFRSLWSFLRRRRADPGEGLLLLFLASVLYFLSSSRFGAFRTARYVLPLYSVVPFLAAAAVSRARGRVSSLLKGGLCAVMAANVAFHFFSLSHELPRAVEADRETRAMMEAFDANGLESGLAEYWDGWRFNFLTGEKVVFADPDGERYPPYRARAEADPDMALLLSWSDVDASLGYRGVRHRSTSFGRLKLISGIGPPPERLRPLDRGGWSVAEPGASCWIDGLRNGLPGEPLPCEGALRATIDLGKIAEPALVRVVVGEARGAYPGRWKVWSSMDGSDWEMISDYKAFYHSFVSGPKAYSQGLFFRCEWLLTGGPCRYVRLQREESTDYRLSPLVEVYLYEREGAEAVPALPDAFFEFVEREGVDFVYADRWESALVVSRMGERRASVPWNAFYHGPDGSGLVAGGGRKVFLLPAAEIEPVREILTGAVVAGERSFGDYVALVALIPWEGPTGLSWTGTSLLYEGRGGKAYWLRKLARLNAERGRREEAEGLYRESLALVPDYYLARRELAGLAGGGAAGAGPSAAGEAPERAVGAVFEGGATLLGVSLRGDGEGREIDYHWRFEEAPDPRTWVFVHMDTGEGRLQDDFPVARDVSAYLLRDGNVVRFTRHLPAEASRGKGVEATVGLWIPEEGKRLSLRSTGGAARRDGAVIPDLGGGEGR